ncbi:MAG: histidine--tRNA ligase [Planctomycetes bacterium]|nr:histidine--tRNA ligase [Planctomycetota bacterium]
MKPQALRGFRDYLPAEMLAKNRMLDRVAATFESFGYPPLATPALEYTEILLGKYGEEEDKLLYRFKDNGERDVCMRYDLTVPLARVLAEHGDVLMPFRRYQIAPVWRAEKPARGRYREFLQCDADLVGVNDPAADAEMLLLGAAVLRSLGIEGFQMRVNHRGILKGLTKWLGLSAQEPEAAFLRLLDKLPKIGEGAFMDEAEREHRLSGAKLDGLRRYVAQGRSTAECLAAMGEIAEEDAGAAEGVARLRRVLDLAAAGGAGGAIALDSSIARGLGYYTGIIYETFLDDRPDFGSVMSGGRYDDLVGIFANRSLPAVGISLGVDRLFAALEELRPAAKQGTPARVLVALFDEAGVGAALAFAGQLRAAGIAAVVYPEPAKLKKQLKYASEIGVAYAAILGSDEIAAGEVTLKAMASGIQERLAVGQAIARLRESLA